MKGTDGEVGATGPIGRDGAGFVEVASSVIEELATRFAISSIRFPSGEGEEEPTPGLSMTMAARGRSGSVVATGPWKWWYWVRTVAQREKKIPAPTERKC